MQTAAHLHPKMPDRNRKGGMASTGQRFPQQAINECFDCLVEQWQECPRGLESCEEKSVWQGYLDFIAQARMEREGVAA